MQKKIKKGFMICVILVLLFILCLVAYIFIPRTCKTKKINDYGKFDKFQNYEMMSDLVLFPPQIKRENINDYFYSYKEYIFGAKCQIYLKCSYSDKEYKEQADRLRNLQVETSWGAINKSKYDQKNFMYSAYLLSNGLEGNYEYALFDDSTQTVYYIFLHDISKNEIEFSPDLLPNDYLLNDSNRDLFNVYMFDVNGAYKNEAGNKKEKKLIE